MKIKNAFQFLGFRGKPKLYPYQIETMDLDGVAIQFAHWLHPREKAKMLTTGIVDAYREIVRDGDFCIDIGAHTGDTTLPMALASGVTGCVLALEPNPFVYHVLEKNARANIHVANIRTMMAAAGPDEGFTEFEYSDSGFCNGGRHEGIPATKHGHPFRLKVFCVNLQQELREHYSEWLPRLKYIKVDAEGYDLYVLEAIRGIIQEHQPIITAEVYKRTDMAYRKKLLSFFRHLDYSVHQVVEEPTGTGPQLTEEKLHELQHTYNILCRPPG